MKRESQGRREQSRSKAWLTARRWRLVQASVPILCVDVLPIRSSRSAPHSVEAIGLILRETPHQGQKWCLIGGRVLYGESLQIAIIRQLRETLGNRARIRGKRSQHPLYIAQYAPHGLGPFALDPRQHAIGLTYVSEITGAVVPQGEAVDFEWFDVRKLPSRKKFGFDQDQLVKRCLQRLRSGHSQPRHTLAPAEFS